MDNITLNPTAVQVPVYAGFWLRVLSYIIDALILGIIQTIAITPMLAMMGLSASFGWMHAEDLSDEEKIGMFASFLSMYMMTILVSTVAGWLYYALMESSGRQATLGKIAVGIRVTDLEGGRISFLNATGRYFGKILSALTLCIGFMMAGFTEKKQALHDILANTLVIKN